MEERDARTQRSIFRYMSLEKFLWLIESEKLWFSRLDQIGDAFEGAPTSVEFRKLFEIAQNVGELLGRPCQVNRYEFESQNRLILQALQQSIYASCWHLDPGDQSMAMWKIYGDRGVAIESTINRIGKAVSNGSYENPHGNDVSYIADDDHSTQFMDTWGLVFRKRKCFRFEQEYRFAVHVEHERPSVGPSGLPTAFQPPPPPRGIALDVDLRTLIVKVHTAPSSGEDLLTPTLRAILDRFKLDIEVAHSDLLNGPQWRLIDDR